MRQEKRRFIVAAGVAAVAAVFATGSPSALAQSKPPIKLGLLTAVSGPISTYGKMQELVVRMAVEDVNAKGGINGSRIELKVEDVQLDPGQAVLLFRKLANEGYFGVIGPITGTQWETVSPIANQISMPAIAANASKPGITVRPWTLRLVPADDTLIPEGFKAFLAANKSVKRVAIVADVREASGKAGAEVFQKLAKDNGIQVLETIEFSTRATDLSPAAIKVKSLNPDAVLVVALGPSALLLAKEFTTQGITKPVLAQSIIWPGPFVNMVGDNGKNWHTIGFSTNDRVPGNNELNASVVKRVLERADATLGQPANMANWTVSYDCVLVYADILRRLGVDGSADPKKVREAIKDEFVKLKEFSGINNYRIRDTGDGYIPGTVLVPDLQRKMWKFAN
jgi:branched-chain amino acid transport system substrate-binding protein